MSIRDPRKKLFPCGYRSDPRRVCRCTPSQIENYLSKISGSLLDWIDLRVEVPAVPFTQLAEMPPGPSSADLRAQVLEARDRQATRFGARGPQVNGWMTPLKTTRIYSAMGLLKPGQALMAVRPFRPPRHSVSDAGSVSGGTIPQPGEFLTGWTRVTYDVSYRRKRELCRKFVRKRRDST